MHSGRVHEVFLNVPFHDLDPMGVVWHGNYLKYFDIARFALFEAGGVDLYRYSKENNCLFPVIQTTTKHIQSLRNGDRFVCKAKAMDASIKIVIDFEILRIVDRVVCAKGRGEQVAVRIPDMETLYEIPDDVRHALGF